MGLSAGVDKEARERSPVIQSIVRIKVSISSATWGTINESSSKQIDSQFNSNCNKIVKEFGKINTDKRKTV